MSLNMWARLKAHRMRTVVRSTVSGAALMAPEAAAGESASVASAGMARLAMAGRGERGGGMSKWTRRREARFGGEPPVC